MNKKYKNLSISLVIITACTAILLMIFYPSTSELGKGFTIRIIYMLTLYSALITGVIFLLFRIVRFFKKSDSLIYVLSGTLNVLVGLFGIVLYFLNKAEMQWLHKSLLNLLVGVLMIVDSFLLKYTFEKNEEND